MGGADLGGLAEVLAATELDVIASGGVGTLDDLLALADGRGGRPPAGRRHRRHRDLRGARRRRRGRRRAAGSRR